MRIVRSPGWWSAGRRSRVGLAQTGAAHPRLPSFEAVHADECVRVGAVVDDGANPVHQHAPPRASTTLHRAAASWASAARSDARPTLGRASARERVKHGASGVVDASGFESTRGQ